MRGLRQQGRADVQVSSLPMTRMRHRAQILWACLLVAMLAAQSLGLLHTIVHAGPAYVESHVGSIHDEARESHERAVSTGWFAKLFAAHGDESDCRLYDHFSHGDCMPVVPALSFWLQLLPDFLQVFEASSPLMPAALVQARGPPSVR